MWHRKIRAAANEWIHIRRRGWQGLAQVVVLAAVVIGALWLAYAIFCGIVAMIQAVIQGIASFLSAATPFVLIVAIISGIVSYFINRKI